MNYEDQGMVMKLPDPYSEQNNFIHRDAYNKINFTEWGEEDGDFELEEEFNQSNQIQAIQDNNTQQELSSGTDQQDVEKTVTPDQLHLTHTNDEQVDEVTIDDDTHFPPRDNEMKSILEEIEKLEQSESVQVNEIPVQSVLIDRNDVSTLENEITKSQQSEKGRKKVSKKSTTRRKPKSDIDSVQPVENNLYSEDDPSADPNKASSDSKKTSSKRSLEKRNPKSAKVPSKSYDVLMGSDNSGESLDSSHNFQDSQQNLGSCDSSNSALDTIDPELDSIVCEICHEGLSKKGNWIILCDRCDTPYHQLCHIPTIDDDFADSDKEWICMGCTNSRTKKRQKMNNPEMIDTSAKILTSEQQIITPNTDISTTELDIQPSSLTKDQMDLPISALLTREQKVEYLSSLPQSVLVDLILLAEHMQPGLPLYPANVLQKYFHMNDSKQDEFQSKPELATPSTEMDITELSIPIHFNDTDRSSQLKETPEIMSPVSIDGPPNNMNADEFLSYSNMIIKAISAIVQPNGNTAQTIYNWIKGHYSVPPNFQHTAKKYLSEMLSKGILVKTSKAHYKINSAYNHAPVKVNCDDLFKPLNVKIIQSPSHNGQSPRKSLTKPNDPALLLSKSLNGQVNQESFQQSIGFNCQIDKGLSQQPINFIGQANQVSFHQKNLIEKTNQVSPHQSSIQQSKSPLQQHVNRTLSNLPDHASSRSPSGSQNSNLIPVDNQIKDANMINNDHQLNQKSVRSLVSVASLMNNDQARTGLRIPQSYQMDRYIKQSNIQARSGIRPPSQIPSGLKKNNNQSRSEIPRSHSAVMNQNHISIENSGNISNGIPSLSSNQRLSVVTNNNDQSNIGIPSMNSFSSQQRYAAMNNNNQSPIAARPLLPIPTNQSFPAGNAEIGPQSMIVPPMQPIQPNPQQTWPTSFNSFYMIPNSNESNQYGLMQTYSYGPNHNQISFDGHNAMHNSLINENPNNHNGQPRNSPATPHLQPMGQIGQMGQSLSQR